MQTALPFSPEQRFQLLMDAACDYAIFFTDVEGCICEWSAGAQKLIGYTEAEALELNAEVIFTPEDRARGAPQVEQQLAIRDGQANDERWHVRKDGTWFFAVGRLVALKVPEGRLTGFAKIVRDVTPHKKLEHALRVSDELFRATFAQAPIGMVLTDLAGRIQEVNAAFCRLTGYKDSELEGRSLISLTELEQRARVQGLIEEMLAGGREHMVIEKQMVRADGSLVWVQNSCAVLRNTESFPLKFIDLMQDISALKLSELELGRVVDQRTAALRDKTKQMEAFCYTIAHDLRAPLRAIAGYADFMRRDFSALLPQPGLDYLHRIEASAARLDRLISDLLGYTHTQQLPVVREEVDLTSLVLRIAEQVKHDMGNPHLDITLVSPLGTVRADAVTLEHVFLNLISNAVKFAREGVPPEIRIWSEERGSVLRVWVEDNGIGVEPRYADRVFGMFERLHTDRKIPGTGMGLAIVATAIDRLGGSRGVEPNRPAGSRFWIELPR